MNEPCPNKDAWYIHRDDPDNGPYSIHIVGYNGKWTINCPTCAGTGYTLQ